MDDDSQSNQGSSDENKIAELEHELEELEKQKKVREKPQNEANDNKDQVVSKVGGDTERPDRETLVVESPAVASKTSGQEALSSLEEKYKPKDTRHPSDDTSVSRRKSNLLYYIGIALMVSSIVVAALNFFLGR